MINVYTAMESRISVCAMMINVAEGKGVVGFGRAFWVWRRYEARR
jgi:hypothetical protein